MNRKKKEKKYEENQANDQWKGVKNLIKKQNYLSSTEIN